MNTPSNPAPLLPWTLNAANAFTQALAHRAGVTLPKLDGAALCGDAKPARWLADRGVTNRKTAEAAGETAAAELICWQVEGGAETPTPDQRTAYLRLKAEDFALAMRDGDLLLDLTPQETADGRYLVQLTDDRGTDSGSVEFDAEAEAEAFIDQVMAFQAAA